MDDVIESISDSAHGDLIVTVAIAIAMLAATAVVAAVVTRLIRRITQADGSPLPSSSILVNIARITIWAIGISVILSACFNVDVNALITALGVGGIAVSLGLQDTIKNFIGGFQVTVMGIVHPGDHIIVGGVEGIVSDVSWRQTVVEDIEKCTHLIPNSVINSTMVTKVEPEHLVSTVVVLNNDGREIDSLLREMELLAKRAVEEVAPLEKDPWLLATQIGEYGIWAKMRFVLADMTNAREARDAALRAIAPYTRNNVDEVPLGLAPDETGRGA